MGTPYGNDFHATGIVRRPQGWYLFGRGARYHGQSASELPPTQRCLAPNSGRSAFALKLLDHPIEEDEEKNLLVGFDTHANLIEIV
jgi:hypothetical protein